MGASTLLSLGIKAMAANYAGLQTTGHNISNAGVEGYSRQRVELATSKSQFDGVAYMGQGVDIESVSRAYNRFLFNQRVNTSSQEAYDQVRADHLAALEPVFGGGEQGLGHSMGQLFNSMVDMASRPTDLAARQVVLAQADDVVQRFASASQRVDDAQSRVTQALDDAVRQVNDLSARIAEVNARFASLRSADAAPNDLLDQRDQLVTQLGALLQVSTVTDAATGTLSVFVAGGQRVVLGTQSVPLAVGADAYDGSRRRLMVLDSDGTRPLHTEALGSGTIAGLMRFQDDDLVKARSLLGQMTQAMAGAVNAQQAAGLDMTGAAGQPLFSLGTPLALPASTNNGGGIVSLAVDNPALLHASEYELYHDGTDWVARELPQGMPQSIASGPVDGFTISFGAPPPAPGDHFLLQPVGRAAQGLARAFLDPRGLAAATATSENANALALVALRDAPLVQRMRDSGTGTLSGGSTITDAWSSAMAAIGVRVQGGRTAAEISASVARGASDALAGVAGVNLDEEAANLIHYQQGYQAAAKVLQVAQSIFDSLLNATSG